MEIIKPLLNVQEQNIMSVICRGEEVTGVEAHVVWRLSGRGFVPIKQVANEVLKSMSNVSLICNKIERKGLLKRTSGEYDFRTINVCLTEKGEEVANRLNQKVELMEKFLEEEARAAGIDLEQVLAQLDALYSKSIDRLRTEIWTCSKGTFKQFKRLI